MHQYKTPCKKIAFSGDLEAPREKSRLKNAKGPPFEAEIFSSSNWGLGVSINRLDELNSEM